MRTGIHTLQMMVYTYYAHVDVYTYIHMFMCRLTRSVSRISFSNSRTPIHIYTHICTYIHLRTWCSLQSRPPSHRIIIYTCTYIRPSGEKETDFAARITFSFFPHKIHISMRILLLPHVMLASNVARPTG